jgi:hypothetical protein
MLTVLPVLASVAGVALLAAAIQRLVRLVRESVLFRAPLVAEQTLHFEHAGDGVMHAEAPLATTIFRGNRYAPPPAFRGLEYALRHAGTGLEIPLGGVLGVGAVSGTTKTRIPLKRFRIEQPGDVTLTVSHLAPDTKTEGCVFVFTRPYGVAMPAWILAIVAGGLLFIGGVVFTVLRLSGAL